MKILKHIKKVNPLYNPSNPFELEDVSVTIDEIEVVIDIEHNFIEVPEDMLHIKVNGAYEIADALMELTHYIYDHHGPLAQMKIKSVVEKGRCKYLSTLIDDPKMEENGWMVSEMIPISYPTK